MMTVARAAWRSQWQPHQGPTQLRWVWPLAGPFGAVLLAAMAITTLH